MTVCDLMPDNVENCSQSELAVIQERRLRWTIHHAYENSAFYRKKFQELGLQPGDIRDLEDITKLPFTTKDDIRDNYPFGMMAVPEDKIVRIHASSGTTGKRIVVGYTQGDVTNWADMMARCLRYAGITPHDRVQITTGYGLWTAGVGFQLGVERLGAMAVPVGPAGTEAQLELMLDMGTTAFASTSSYALLLAEEVSKRGIKDQLKLRVGVIGSERWSDKMRRRIEELLGIESFDIIGMTELYGPGIGIDCCQHEGIHYWADHFLFEIVDPDTGASLEPGEEGELVVTTLTKEGMPLIRYKTRDITRLIPKQCSCGSSMPLVDRILSRTDDMIKVRGVAIYPGQVDSALSQVQGLSSEYRIVLRREEGRDYMTVRVECDPEYKGNLFDLSQEVVRTIKNKIGVTTEVEVVPFGSLPRSEKKTKRIIDEREL